MLARLESEEAENAVKTRKARPESRKRARPEVFFDRLLEPQLQQVNSEITGLRGEIER